MQRSLIAGFLLVFVTAAASAAGVADLPLAEQLAWEKRFAESEALYRRILTDEPASHEASLGLARVILWQGRYAEAIARFDGLRGIEALEGRATAEYWSGDLRAAARNFRRVLAIDPDREYARTSLRDIESTARPSQRVTVDGRRDDQPLDSISAEVASTFYSDPLTRWSVITGMYRLDAGAIGAATGQHVALENETRLAGLILGGRIGLFTFPDGARRPVGGVSVRRGSWTLAVDHRQETSSATAVNTHAASTTGTLRWTHDRHWMALVELSVGRYFDDNQQQAATAYAVVPVRRGAFTFWGGASANVRDTDQSRFRIRAIASTFDEGVFQYQYRGQYDPYWSPDDLREARLVGAVEHRNGRAGVKLYGDAGYARDRGQAFGPETGSDPFPASTFRFAFDRAYHPWRAGIVVDVLLAPHWRFEMSAERGATIDYRTTTLHASLVRRH